MNNKKGDILSENVIFIILNVVFFAILILFISQQGKGAIVLEQSYAKNIALLIDSAKPVTEMVFDMREAFDLAQKNGIASEEIVKVSKNIVTVKLSQNGGYQYSFFNDVNVTVFPDIIPNKNYVIKINRYNKNE